MKKYIAFLACFLASMSANAAFITLPDGVTPSTDLLVEFTGTPVGDGFSSERSVYSNVQFLLSALDESQDDLNSDGFLTINFAYYSYDPVSPTFLGWDTSSANSILWSDIALLQASAAATDELNFSSRFNDVVPGPYTTQYESSQGEFDYLVLALVENGAQNAFYVGGQYWGIDLEIPPPPPTPPGDAVNAPASFGMFAIALAGLALRRRIK
jgi:hypothetical protein